ncbi:MAG: response regulator transcription factor [bacterium]|nr:response regulator transcription factor [bacterium]
MKTIKILIADDHNLVRAGIKLLIEGLEGVEVVSETGDGNEIPTLIQKTNPDILLLDISMPGVNGLDFCKKITSSFPNIKIIILSMHSNEEYIKQALKNGAKGYLLKDSAISELEIAIKSVYREEVYLSPQVSKILVEDYLEKVKDPLDILTERQREILRLIAEGYSIKEIANTLGISAKTVETHRAQIMEKLNIYDTVGLVKFAIKTGLIKLE